MSRILGGGSLARRLLVFQLVVVALIVGIGAVVSVWTARERTREQERQRVLALATTLAQSPEVTAALSLDEPARRLQPLAERVRRGADVAFVVVMSPAGIRYSHPDPDRIGERFVGTIAPAAAGEPFTETYRGTLGPSVRAVVPVADATGRVVGLVSAGVLSERISGLLAEQLPELLALAAVALAVGAALSLVLARRVKRQTLGLEPGEITALYQHHDATLHAIREGVLVLDADRRLLLANDEARRLLGLSDDAEGRAVGELLPAGPLRDALADGAPRRDETALVGDRVLVVNQSATVVDGRVVGSVATLRDRTELRALGSELDAVRGMAASLRAHAHESANQLHTLVGLIELGRHEEAIAFATEQVALAQDLLQGLQERVDEPALVALLLGKTAAASERGIALELSDESVFRGTGLPPTELVTILGNLIDNAMDAIGAREGPRWIEVTLLVDAGEAIVEVRDSGPGIPPGDLDRVFAPGWSTKEGGIGGRGLGLALVRHAAQRLGGSAAVVNDGGAVFTVRLPVRARAEAT